jgi:hypothetical protein
VEVVVGLDAAAFGLGAGGGAVVIGSAAVLADQGGDQVDVVVGVADGGPAAARAVAGVDAGGGDDPSGGVGPLGVGEGAVSGGGPDGGVPDVLVGAGVVGDQVQGFVQEMGEVAEGGSWVAAGVGGEAVEGGDEVGVGVFLAAAGAVEVGEQADGTAALFVDGGD